MTISFKQFLNEAKNTHLEHLNDLLFNEGVNGARNAINYLRSLRDMLAGNSQQSKVVTVKFDGCLHEDTIIWTSKGDMTIKYIVEHPEIWPNIHLMGKNTEDDIQYSMLTKILDGCSASPKKNWIEIELENGGTIKLTEDHEVHTTNRGWVQAKDLQDGDDITEMPTKYHQKK